MAGLMRSKAGGNYWPFLDGLRGIAAIYVVLHHSVAIAASLVPLTGKVHRLLGWTQYGQIAVAVFIVLSGFCLMLPLVGSEECRFPGGLPRFFYRRSRRILPPYYAALCFSCILILACGKREADRENISVGSLVSHIFLLHNATFTWCHAINSPMWSVATEWQIYFAFAFLLFPTYRRFGIFSAVAIAAIAGVTPHFIFPSYNLDWACPWYLLLFAFGMTSAVFSQRENNDPILAIVRDYNNPLIGALILTLASSFVFKAGLGDFASIFGHSVEGLLTAIVVLRIQQQSAAGVRSILCRILESRPVMFLGAISYSLYLIHWPVMSTIHSVINGRVSAASELILMLVAGIPAAVVAAWIFHCCFERPFLSSRKRSLKEPLMTQKLPSQVEAASAA